MQLALSVPLADVTAFPKLCKAYFAFFEILFRNHIAVIVALDTPVFMRVMHALHEGLQVRYLDDCLLTRHETLSVVFVCFTYARPSRAQIGRRFFVRCRALAFSFRFVFVFVFFSYITLYAGFLAGLFISFICYCVRLANFVFVFRMRGSTSTFLITGLENLANARISLVLGVGGWVGECLRRDPTHAPE